MKKIIDKGFTFLSPEGKYMGNVYLYSDKKNAEIARDAYVPKSKVIPYTIEVTTYEN